MSHNFNQSDIRIITWIFSKPGSSDILTQDGIVSPRVITDRSKVNITGQATLMLKKAEIADNGSYEYTITFLDKTVLLSSVLVIILGKKYLLFLNRRY